jgi:hypothetical protein
MVLRPNDLPVGCERVSGHYTNNVHAGKESAPSGITAADYIR